MTTLVNRQPPVRVVVERRPLVLQPTANTGPVSRGPAGRAPIAMTIRGPLVAAPGVLPFPVPYNMTVQDVQAACAVAPVGAPIVLDVIVNGVSIFTTSPRPTILDGARVGAPVVPDLADLVEGDLVTIDVVQVGSTQPGAGCTIVLQVTEA